MNPNSCPTCEGTRLVVNHPGIDEPCPDCRTPEGSCLICGELAPFAVWSGGVGCCQKCRDVKQERDDAVRDLGNAQQWIDSDPEWKAQYMAIAQDQSARIAELARELAAARAAIKVAREAANELLEHIKRVPERHWMTLDTDQHPPSVASVLMDNLSAALNTHTHE